jgi:hypothetical protein
MSPKSASAEKSSRVAIRALSPKRPIMRVPRACAWKRVSGLGSEVYVTQLMRPLMAPPRSACSASTRSISESSIASM